MRKINGGKFMALSKVKPQVRPRKSLGQRLSMDMKNNYELYLMIIPVVAWYIIFCYIPMYGVLMAFQNYNPLKGISGSPWIGFENFIKFTTDFCKFIRELFSHCIVKFFDNSVSKYFPTFIFMCQRFSFFYC